MRAIKFRGKTEAGEWVYGAFQAKRVVGGVNYLIRPDTQVGAYETARIVIPETVGQFTGLHDIKGKEIYEGDILRIGKRGALICEPIIGTVVYSPYTAMFMIHVKIDYFGFDEIGETGKVIGNKFDNPELLEVEE